MGKEVSLGGLCGPFGERSLRETCSHASTIASGTSPVIRMTSAVKGTA